MTSDLPEAKQQRGPEKAMLEQVEEYQQEVLKERYAPESPESKLSIYLLSSHQTMIRGISDLRPFKT